MTLSNKIKFVTTTKARSNISEIISEVRYKNNIFAIGRRSKIEALIIKFPENFNKNINEITNINANSASFNFLEKEPDLYNINDLRKKYV